MILRNSLLPKPLNQLLPLMLSVALSVAPGFGQSPATGAQQSKDAPQANDSEKGASPRDAQDSVATIAVDVNVVTLPVTVRDKHGEIVKNLSKDDFTLQEDGRAQTIKYFSVEANLPLTLGLLVDTSFSQREALDPERNASRSFLDTMLAQEKDKAFLIHFDREVELLQDLTHSREKLQSALELLKTADPEHGQFKRLGFTIGLGASTSRRDAV